MGENNTVTIPMEEYKNLLEIQARANILKDYTAAEDYSVSRGMIHERVRLRSKTNHGANQHGEKADGGGWNIFSDIRPRRYGVLFTSRR